MIFAAIIYVGGVLWEQTNACAKTRARNLVAVAYDFFYSLFVRLVVKIALAGLLGLSDESCPVCGVFALRLVLLCPRCQCWRGCLREMIFVLRLIF